ncbi:MAG: sensor histidine kinase [Frankiales bacterium]|jgi:signal transduction histidine kinase|nr:sensor histidine kinase [Frankiales bacterium]
MVRRRGAAARRLRSRVRNAIVAGAAVSLLLFGIPLAVVLDRLITSDALTGLQRDATRAVAAVPDNVLEAGQVLRVPTVGGGTRIGVYDARGARVAGVGPASSRLAAQAGDGREHDGRDGDDLAVVVPVLSDTTVAGSVRASVQRDVLRSRVHRAWALLASLALLVIGLSWLLARRSASRVAEPFEDITRAAQELGAGTFDIALPRWGITEADAAAEALSDSANRIDALVAHERAFMRDASHQLRTPLAALVVRLEQQPPDVARALDSAQNLERTIADLLAVRTARGTETCDAGDIAAEATARWHRAGASVILRRDDVPRVAVSASALRQSLDVLLDNALRHGSAPVTVTVEAYGEAVLTEVADRGPGLRGATAGTGLNLATTLMERAGGSLIVREGGSHPRVALLLPLADSAAARDYSSSNR